MREMGANRYRLQREVEKGVTRRRNVKIECWDIVMLDTVLAVIGVVRGRDRMRLRGSRYAMGGASRALQEKSR